MKSTLVAQLKTARGLAFMLANAPEIVGRRYSGTDKVEHGYLPYYRSQLQSLRLRRMVVFEIGVGGYQSPDPGGSLQMWRDYFPRSTIVGIDIQRKVFDFGPRVKFEQADQSSPTDLQRVVDRHGRPTIVIDDGSHIGEHVHASFDHLWPQLVSGGFYVIEDLATSFDPDFRGADPAPLDSAVALVQVLVTDTQVADPVHNVSGLVDSPMPGAQFFDVAETHVYPGIAFIRKRQ